MAITYVDSVSATSNTAAMPAHAVGDELLVAAFAGGTTIPSVGSGYTSRASDTGTASSSQLGDMTATATNDSFGAWGSAAGVLAGIYRGCSGVGAVATNHGTGTSVTFPALTLTNNSGSSWVVYAAIHFGASNFATVTMPTGFTRRTSHTALVLADSNGGVSVNPTAQSITANASNTWLTFAVEITSTVTAFTGAASLAASAGLTAAGSVGFGTRTNIAAGLTAAGNTIGTASTSIAAGRAAGGIVSTPPPSATLATLANTRKTTDEIRRQRKALQRAQTEISIYTNNPDHSPGMIHRGRLNVLDCVKYEWPKKKNVSAGGYFTVRASHYLAKLIAKIPNDPNECKNVLVRVDRYGGKWRWTGLLHHWKVETRDGVDYLTASFNDDMQFLQFLLAPPNPLLPIPIFQFPRDWFIFGPGIWCINTTILLNLIRREGNLWTLPDDPLDIFQWAPLSLLDFGSWQVHVKPHSFLTDSSLWTVIGSRMNTIDSVIADTLDDGQLTMTYRRYFTDEGELVDGLFNNSIPNGGLVFDCEDRSGFSLLGGTFFGGTAIDGLARSVLTYVSGFIEDTLTTVTDTESLYPDEYWHSGFLGQFASAPTVGIHDSWWNDLQSQVTFSPATASAVIVGGDNPTADAIAKLIIESVGNLIGYFLLGGFDSLGTIAADVIMPFLVGTILAWDEWKNFTRATNLGWVHLWEIYQQGAEQNSWSLSALAAMRGGFKATEAETNHTMVIDESTWLIPGLHCDIGYRFWSTSGALQRNAGIELLFVNQLEEMNLSGDENGATKFVMKCGQNKAAMSVGERTARQLKFAADKLADIGFHLVS